MFFVADGILKIVESYTLHAASFMRGQLLAA
jgi:hypothetical protein